MDIWIILLCKYETFKIYFKNGDNKISSLKIVNSLLKIANQINPCFLTEINKLVSGHWGTANYAIESIDSCVIYDTLRKRVL